MALHHRTKGQARRDGSEVLCRTEGRGEERGVGGPRQVNPLAFRIGGIADRDLLQ